MIDLNIVIPVYNEYNIIAVLIEDWKNELDNLNISYRINLYNDGSTDESLELLKTFEEKYSETIKVIDKINSGHGATILKGYSENLDSKWIFQVDSDNETKAVHFKQLWLEKENYDFVIGNRINRNSTLFRKSMSFISYLVVLIFYGKGVKDVNCPFRLMNTSVFKEIIKNIPKNTFAPNILISGMAIKKKLRIKQLDVQFSPRTTGNNSLGQNKLKLLKISIRSFIETISYAKNAQ